MKKTYLLLFIAFLFSSALYAQAPPNDACANATNLTVNGTCIRGTTFNGTTQAGENLTPCNGTNSFTQTVWYKFTATAATMYVQLYADSFVGTGATWAPATWACAVYKSTTCPPTAASMIQCQNSNSKGSNDKIIVDSLTNLTVGATYLIQVGYQYSKNQVPKFCIKVGTDFTKVCNTCANPCGPACGFPTTPTVNQVVSTCPAYPQWPYSEGNQLISQCYTFTAASSTVSFQIIIQSTCPINGNISNPTWTLYKAGTCGAPIQSGTWSNLTFTNLTIGAKYVYCFKWNVPSSCFHSIYWPYFVGAAPLPVELISFTADESQQGILLKWTTASEINNNYFLLERSGDNAEYELVKKVDGAGNSSSLQEYQILDTRPVLGINYYHLVQIDYDGTSHEYGPIAIRFEHTNHLLVVPNPVTDNSTLEYDSDNDKQVAINIIDQTGRVVFSNQQSVSSGKNLIPLNISFLSHGIYFLNVADEGGLQRIKFSK